MAPIIILLCLLLVPAFGQRATSSYKSNLPELPSFTVTADSHIHLGRSIGFRFQNEIKTAMQNKSFFMEKILPYSKTTEGAALYDKYLSTANKTYPQYLEELRGIAEGAGIKFSELFLWNMMFEWQLLMRPQTHVMPRHSCSDVLLSNDSHMIIGHNEDGDPIDMSTGYIVSAQILSTDASKPSESFTAYCYPGELCGNAFGFSSASGVATSMNALFPIHVDTSAIGRGFLNRALITLTYSQIADELKKVPCSSGFSLNVANLNDHSISNFEVGPSGAVTQTEVKNGAGYHFNMYIHSNVPQYEDPSSEHRLERVKHLLSPKNTEDILQILGDTDDEDFPIYRTASKTDGADTLATAIFDVSKGMVSVYRGNPSSSEQRPVFQFTLP